MGDRKGDVKHRNYLGFVYSNELSWPEQYYERARILERDARVIMIFAVLLLIIGGLVFAFAGSITRFDFAANENLSSKIDAAQADLAKTDRSISNYVQDDNNMRNMMLAQINHILLQHKTLPQKNQGADEKLDANTYLLEPDKIAKDISNDLKARNDEDLQFEINLNGVGLVMNLSRQSWQEISSAIAALPVPKEMAAHVLAQAQIAHLREDEEFQRELVQGLIGKRVNNAIYGGQETPEEIMPHPDLRIIQTSITRFGTLAIISFLVAICIPLYRYNVRIAAFYISRGDMLKLANFEESKTIDVEMLARLLTPNFDFGKTIKTPTDQLVEILRIARGTGSKE